MPIYEYKCGSCGNVVEVIQKMSDARLTTCETCSGPLEKLLSRTSFQLSGGGWYKSGYSKGSGAPSKTEGSSEPAGSSEPKKASGGGCGAGCGCH